MPAMTVRIVLITLMSIRQCLLVTAATVGNAASSSPAGCAGADRLHGRPAPARGPRSARPTVVDVLERRVEVLLAGDPGGHVLPERSGADGARHRVRAVEEELAAAIGDLGH